MRNRSRVGLMILLALPTAAAARVEMSARDAEHVRVEWVEGRWTELSGADSLSNDARSLFLISGELRNAGDAPITWVKLGFDLLDERYAVVAHEFGYNHRAEALRDPAVEAGDDDRARLDIRPLPPGASDSFRMVFFRADVPRFVRWRVRVLEVRTRDS